MTPVIFEQLRTLQGLAGLQQAFIDYVTLEAPELGQRYQDALAAPPENPSALMVVLAPFLEHFLRHTFDLPPADVLDTRHLFELRRDFIQRRAVPEWGVQVLEWDEAEAFQGLSSYVAPHTQHNLTGLALARHLLTWLQSPEKHQPALDAAARYCAWAIVSPQGQLRHRDDAFLTLPQKLDPSARVPHLNMSDDLLAMDPAWGRARDGFECTDRGITAAQADMEANYCLWCHEREKDTCSTGLPNTEHAGCPLGQKISEMAFLKAHGFGIGALAVAMVDNPLIAVTGHRICNDCMKACVFQKQTPVQIPALESHILKDVLDLPYGVELYLLLMQWNPLHFKAPLPAPETGKRVLIVGLGPAGFTLAHHLLRLGHTAVAIDGMPIIPLIAALKTAPIQDIEMLNAAHAHGFGGVMDYGITARWDKHALSLVQLSLERQRHFLGLGGVFWGGQMTLARARTLGFDHIVLATGAGRPKIQNWPGINAPGVLMAADFLMALNTLEPFQAHHPLPRRIELPVVVVGGGLTAIDAATEALAYYVCQVENFAAQYDPEMRLRWSVAEQARADTFLAHAAALKEVRISAAQEGRTPNFRALLASWGGATVLYRKSLQEAPAYRLSPEEVTKALEEGVCFLQNRAPMRIACDENGRVSGIETVAKDGALHTVPARTVLLALGVEERHVGGHEVDVTIVGDLDPQYAGSVVKAMASSAHAAPKIDAQLRDAPQCAAPSWKDFKKNLEAALTARVVQMDPIGEAQYTLVIRAPWAAEAFQAGQFYRLQKPGVTAPVAMRPTQVDAQAGTLTFLLRTTNASTRLLSRLSVGETVVLMGPTGAPTQLPETGSILLIGEGAQALLMLPLARMLRRRGQSVFFSILHPDALTKAYRQDLGDVFEVYDVKEIPETLKSLDAPKFSGAYVLLRGATLITSELAQILQPHLSACAPLLTTPPTQMQCMMQGLCGRCLQRMMDPITGEVNFVLTCQTLDLPLDTVDIKTAQMRLVDASF